MTKIDSEKNFENEGLQNMYLTFSIDDEEYAIYIENVIEIVTNQKIIHAPDVPDYIKGLINLRGRVIPLMDVRLRFGLFEKEYDDRTCIIVVETDEISTGLIVDMVKEVVEIPDKNIKSPTAYGKEEGVIENMGKHNDTVTFILNIYQLLYAEDINIKDLQETIPS
ncbi:purine-binding chemotaxis protein CheW [Candidatus Magnetomoraceae bacterium gMMP-15]